MKLPGYKNLNYSYPLIKFLNRYHFLPSPLILNKAVVGTDKNQEALDGFSAHVSIPTEGQCSDPSLMASLQNGDRVQGCRVPHADKRVFSNLCGGYQ